MKYSLYVIKLVVSLCIFFSASTLTHASSSCKEKNHRHCKKDKKHHRSHHKCKGKKCEQRVRNDADADADSDADARIRLRVKQETGDINLHLNQSTPVTDTNAQAQASIQAQAQLQAQAQIQAQLQAQLQAQAQQIQFLNGTVNGLIEQILICCNFTIPTIPATIADFFNDDEFEQTLFPTTVNNASSTLNFDNPLVASGIVKVGGGTFVTLTAGTFTVDFGVVSGNETQVVTNVIQPNRTDYVFQLMVNGELVEGTQISALSQDSIGQTFNQISTTLADLPAGSQIEVKYVNSFEPGIIGADPNLPTDKGVNVSSFTPEAQAAFIKIQKV